MRRLAIKINVLVENHAGNACLSEHGLSLFLELGKTKILFDTGQSSLFIKNAVNMGIDVNDADYVVLSHGHYDHGNGLSYLINKQLVCHIGCFVERFRKRDDKPIGLPLTLKQAQAQFSLSMSDAPMLMDENVYFMGEIPRRLSFEASEPFSYLSDGRDDPIMDDSAVVIKTDKGNVIISGCSHAGICNIVEHAITITGDVRTYAVFGGLHLAEVNDRVEKTIEYLANSGVKFLYPVHCTSDEVVDALKLGLEDVEVRGVIAGDQVVI